MNKVEHNLCVHNIFQINTLHFLCLQVVVCWFGLFVYFFCYDFFVVLFCFSQQRDLTEMQSPVDSSSMRIFINYKKLRGKSAF